MATITGTDASDFLVGTADGDLVNGGLGNDTIRGLGGNDTLNGAEGNDDLDGGDGNDWLIGGAGNDTMQGGMNADTLEGGAGNDVLRGGKGFDSLVGGDGDDTLYSGLGQDTMTGGAGADVFVVRGSDPNFPGALKAPNITDFVAGTDSIVVEGATTAEITDALTAQTTVDGGVQFTINGATVVVKGTGLTSLTASNVSNAIPSSNAGQTFTLTTGIDALTGSAGDDTFVGDNATAAAADQVNGGSGTDTLKLYGNAAEPAHSGVEIIYLEGNTAGFNVSDNADVTTLQLVDPTTAQTYTLANGQKASVSTVAATEVVDFAGNTVTSLDLTLTGVGTSAGDATIDLNSTAQTTLNVSGATTASFVTLANTGAKLATLNVSGDTALTIGSALTTITKIDASAATGNVRIDAVGASNLSFTGGAGNDRIDLAATLDANDTLEGGAGTDTFTANPAATTGAILLSTLKVTGFETFGVNALTTTGAASADLTKYSLTGFNIEGALDVTAGALTVKASDGVTVTAKAATAGGAANFIIDVVDASKAGTANTVNYVIDADDIDTTGFAIAGVETLNIVSKDADGGTSNIFTDIDGAQLQTINISSSIANDGVAEAMVITDVESTLVSKVDASNFNGDLTVTGLANNFIATGVTYTGAKGVDIITGGAGADVISTGAGADQVTSSVGADSITLGAGADTYIFAAYGDAGDTIADFTAGTGGDVFDMNAAVEAFGNTATAISFQKVTATTTAFTAGSSVIAVGGAAAASSSTTDVATFLDSYGNNATFAAADDFLFIVNIGGGNAGVYRFDSAGADDTVTAAELTLLTTLTGVDANNLVAANFV